MVTLNVGNSVAADAAPLLRVLGGVRADVALVQELTKSTSALDGVRSDLERDWVLHEGPPHCWGSAHRDHGAPRGNHARRTHTGGGADRVCVREVLAPASGLGRRAHGTCVHLPAGRRRSWHGGAHQNTTKNMGGGGRHRQPAGGRGRLQLRPYRRRPRTRAASVRHHGGDRLAGPGVNGGARRRLPRAPPPRPRVDPHALQRQQPGAA